METKFTKGEWCIFNDRIGLIDKSDSQSHGMMNEIAYIDMCNFGDFEGEANAHLIAAAPEMYDLLERLTSHDNCKKDIIHLLGEADNLLAKARGE